MDTRTRSSSSSSLFNMQPIPKVQVKKGSFTMTHFACPVETVEQSSMTTESTHRPRGQTLVGNSYKMAPDKRIQAEVVREIIQSHLSRTERLEYDAKRSREQSKALADGIMRELKALGLPRFRFICTVTIGQVKGQSVRMASRCVWDTEHDNFVSESFRNESIFAVGTVYGVYKE